MTTHVCFLDIDGPMIPLRARFLSGTTDTFDPVATSLLLKLCERATAKIVMISSRCSSGFESCVSLLERNGVPRSLLHDDWTTQRHMSSTRVDDTQRWLTDHPEVTHHVVIDDLYWPAVNQPTVNVVKCDDVEGMSWRNFQECCIFLGCVRDIDATKSFVQYRRRVEIDRASCYYPPQEFE